MSEGVYRLCKLVLLAVFGVWSLILATRWIESGCAGRLNHQLNYSPDGAAPDRVPEVSVPAIPGEGVRDLTVEAYIDGDSELHVTPEGLYWKCSNLNKPGVSDSGRAPTYINGGAWDPRWHRPASDRGPDESDPLTLPIGPLDFRLETLSVTRKRGGQGTEPRDPVTLKTIDGELVVSIPDSQPGGRWYKLRLVR